MKHGSWKLPFFFIGTLVVLWTLLFFYVSPKDIVSGIGVKNTYFIAFLIAVVGGVSSITGTSFFASIATFAAGGANPYLLGIIGGAGMCVSDAIFFYLISYGKAAIPPRWRERTARLTRFLRSLPRPAVMTGIFLYAGLTPLPGDILLAALALSDYEFPEILPFLFLGNVSAVILISLLGRSGVLNF